ncbi:class I SAM-dependent methyltransferase [bacterium]|nr:class I SAM-dependent methyltransferase [bacterium]
MNDVFSKKMHEDTEKPGQYFDRLTHSVILDRYHFATQFVKDKSVLEVGPGAGFGLEYLSSLASHYDALEFSQENIELLGEQDIGLAKLSQGDAHKIPFVEGRFDVVLALAMIYYLDLETFLNEAHRCLSDDGVLFFCSSNKDVPGFCKAQFTTRYYSVPELASELEEAGFDGEFFGAFPKDGNVLLMRVLAAIKNIVKSVFYLSGLGRQLWSAWRLKSLGDLIQLPVKITQENIKSTSRIRLNPQKPNADCRVIYVVARKKSR